MKRQTKDINLLRDSMCERLIVKNNLSYWPGNCRINTRNGEIVIRFAALVKCGVATAPDGLPELPEVVKPNPFVCLIIG